MPHLAGNIEAISIKPLAQPDNYGNTFRASLKIGEDWLSYGTLKKDAINVKMGSDWVQVAKGMEVEFMYKQNGDFKNIDKKSFTVTDATSSAPPPSSQPQQQYNAPQASKGGFVNPAEIGQCLNLAAEVLKLDGKQLLDDAEVTKAIAWYKAVREKFNELYVGVEAGSVETKPLPKKKAVVVEEDMYDDDSI